MSEDTKYFIGYDVYGEIIKIEIELTPEFQKCCRSSNRLKNIDFFTQTFDYKTFIDFLRESRLLNFLKEVNLYKKEINPDTGLEEIFELRGGFAFSDSIPYFKIEKIKAYFKEHITDQEFLMASIEFFKKYFGLKKPIPVDLKNFEIEQFLSENTPYLYSSYQSLIHYLRFLQEKQPYEPKKINYRKRINQRATESTNLGSCRASIDKMIEEILHAYETDPDEDKKRYEGLHDLATFICSFEQEHNLERSNLSSSDYHFGGRYSKSKYYAQSNERDEAPGQGKLF